MAFANSIYSCALLLMEAGGKTLGVPFASITWSRFNGSAALPRSTLSLRAESGSATGWLPCNELTLDRLTRRVKRALHVDAGWPEPFVPERLACAAASVGLWRCSGVAPVWLRCCSIGVPYKFHTNSIQIPYEHHYSSPVFQLGLRPHYGVAARLAGQGRQRDGGNPVLEAARSRGDPANPPTAPTVFLNADAGI
jgi:hypothetical protein